MSGLVLKFVYLRPWPNQLEKAHGILVLIALSSKEGSGESGHVFADSPGPSLLAHTKHGCERDSIKMYTSSLTH